MSQMWWSFTKIILIIFILKQWLVETAVVGIDHPDDANNVNLHHGNSKSVNKSQQKEPLIESKETIIQEKQESIKEKDEIIHEKNEEIKENKQIINQKNGRTKESDQTTINLHNNNDNNNSDNNHHKMLETLLNEVGETSPKKVLKKIYQDDLATQICWKEIIYIRENNFLEDDRFCWREYQLIFNYPTEEVGDEETIRKTTIEENENQVKEEYQTFKLKFPEETDLVTLRFKIIEKSKRYTLNKYERMYCGEGNFITKSFYKWPNSNRTKVVINFSDHTDIAYEANTRKKKMENDNDDNILGSSQNVVLEKKNSTKDTDAKILDLSTMRSKEKTNNSTHDIMDHPTTTTMAEINEITLPKNFEDILYRNIGMYMEPPTTTEPAGSTENYFSIDDENDKSREIEKADNSTIDSEQTSELNILKLETDLNETNETGSELMVMDQILGGKNILRNLLHIKKDEKIILKGDILVSKKYIDKKDKKEHEEPLYIIHEGTQIEHYDVDDVKE